MMNVLVVVNDQPYGSERPYNALRLANALSKRNDVELRMFLLATPSLAPWLHNNSPKATTTSTACSKGSCTARRSAAAAHASTHADSRKSCS
jgi:hypothetical protein